MAELEDPPASCLKHWLRQWLLICCCGCKHVKYADANSHWEEKRWTSVLHITSIFCWHASLYRSGLKQPLVCWTDFREQSAGQFVLNWPSLSFSVSTCWCLLKSWNSHIDQQHLRNDYVPVHEICRYENLHFALLHNVNSTRLPSFRSFGRHSIYQCAITQWLITSLLSASAPRSSLSPKNSIITSSSFHPGAVCCQTAGKLEWLQLPPPAPSRSAGNINQLFIHKDYCSCYLWNQIWAGRLHGCLLPPRFVLSSSCPCQNKIRPLS